MDLRNYGVIDFAEHVVLPTGDVEVGAWYSNGKKAQKIAELQEKNDHTERLLKARTAELAESNTIIVNIEAELEKVKAGCRESIDNAQKNLDASKKDRDDWHGCYLYNYQGDSAAHEAEFRATYWFPLNVQSGKFLLRLR